MIFDFLIFLLGIFAIINNALYGVGLIILSIILFIYGIFLFTRKSDEGKIQYDLWKDFKKDISHFETKNFNISEDQTLIYAIALGLPMEKLDDYRQSVNLDYYPMYWGYWYFLTSKKVVHYLKIELLEASMAILELLPLLPLVVGRI